MLRHSRVSGEVDVSRLAEAVSRPGIDPRVWISFGYAAEDSVLEQGGQYVDIFLAPSEQEITCRVGSEYAGPGYGLYAPVSKNDFFSVEIPDGDQNHGGIVTRRLWSQSDQVPQEALDNPGDVVWRVKDGANFRLVVNGGGNLYFSAVDANQQFVLGSIYRTDEGEMNNQNALQLGLMSGYETALAAVGGLLDTAGAFMLIPVAGAMIAGPFITAAGALITSTLPLMASADLAIQANIQQFEAGSQDYLSNTIFGAS